MNLSKEEAALLVKEIIDTSELANDVTKIFFPAFILVPSVVQAVNGSGFYTGAQNCSEHDKGAYTGEVSASMLKSVGCDYVLVGHSERRTYFNETDEQLSKKIEKAFTNNITPVFCFGEQLSGRKAGKHFDTVKQQLKNVLQNFNGDQFKKMILAYEPVWAIGTGETATPQQAQEMHAFVRNCIAELFDKNTADEISILYGGSCNAQNAKELFACADVDGGLIGGASLKAEDFCKIINSF